MGFNLEESDLDHRSPAINYIKDFDHLTAL